MSTESKVLTFGAGLGHRDNNHYRIVDIYFADGKVEIILDRSTNHERFVITGEIKGEKCLLTNRSRDFVLETDVKKNGEKHMLVCPLHNFRSGNLTLI